jgi:gas vesicle protein
VSQESSNNDGLLSLLAGVAVGAMIGATVALVTAPQSGEQTRNRLREGAEDTLTKLRESVDDLRVKLDELVHRRAQAAGEELETAGPAGL